MQIIIGANTRLMRLISTWSAAIEPNTHSVATPPAATGITVP